LLRTVYHIEQQNCWTVMRLLEDVNVHKDGAHDMQSMTQHA